LHQAFRRVAMVGFLSLLLWSCSFLAGITTAHADLDQVAFRGIKWGAKCSKVRGFQPVKNWEGTERIFKRDGDKMKLGSMPLTSIRYLCISDKFV
jgi:hypothetical protein